jgi:hypothetical protein
LEKLKVKVDHVNITGHNSMYLSVALQSEFLATDPEVPGSIPGATTFSEK